MSLDEAKIITLKQMRSILNRHGELKTTKAGKITCTWDAPLAEDLYLQLRKRLQKYLETELNEMLKEFGCF